MTITHADMFEKCHRCNGSGQDPMPHPESDQNPCDRCRGYGEILTESGQAMADVIAYCRRPLAWEQRNMNRVRS